MLIQRCSSHLGSQQVWVVQSLLLKSANPCKSLISTGLFPLKREGIRFPETMFLVLLPGAQREKDLGSKAHFAVSMTIKDMLGVTLPPLPAYQHHHHHTHRFLDHTIFFNLFFISPVAVEIQAPRYVWLRWPPNSHPIDFFCSDTGFDPCLASLWVFSQVALSPVLWHGGPFPISYLSFPQFPPF